MTNFLPFPLLQPIENTRVVASLAVCFCTGQVSCIEQGCHQRGKQRGQEQSFAPSHAMTMNTQGNVELFVDCILQVCGDQTLLVNTLAGIVAQPYVLWFACTPYVVG